MNDFIKPYLKYAQFTGRSDRKEFWYFCLFYILVSAILSVIDGVAFGGGVHGVIGQGFDYSSSGPLATIFGIASFIPGIAVSVRRLHDTNRSGWLYLLWLIPIIGWILLLIWYCQKGQPTANAHGEPPEGSRA